MRIKKTLLFFEQSKLRLFLLFFLIALGFYFNTQDGRLSSDFYNWVNTYEQGSFSDLWTCFGYPGLHQLYHIPFYFSYKIFGLNVWAWHFEFLAIHSFNGLLLFLFAKKLLLEINENVLWSFFPTLLFLLSPYQTEVVAWGACIHYLLMTSFLLLSLLFLFNYFKNKKSKDLVWFHLFYILALFCMEQSYLFIVLNFGFALLFQKKYTLSFKEIFSKIVLPQFLIIILYFALLKISVGHFIGHYGAEAHLTFDIDIISDNLFKYLGKFIFFFRYTFESLNAVLTSFVLNDGTQIVTGVLFLIACFYFFIKKPFQGDSKIHYILFSLGAFVCVLAPVLNLVMTSNWSIQTDRYSYVASSFIFLFLLFTILYLPRRLAYFSCVFYLLFSAYNLYETNIAWRENGILKNQIIDNFPKNEQRMIYLINQPDNHQGAHLFRNGLDVALDFEYKTSLRPKGKLKYITLINSLNLEDSCTVKKIGDNKYNVELTHWGRWFHDVNNESKNYVINEKWSTGFNFSILNNSDSVVFMKLDKGKWEYIND